MSVPTTCVKIRRGGIDVQELALVLFPREHELRRNHAVLEALLALIDVEDEEIQRRDPLDQPRLAGAPTRAPESREARSRTGRCARCLLLAVDGEGDALVHERELLQALPPLDLARREGLENRDQGPVVRARASRRRRTPRRMPSSQAAISRRQEYISPGDPGLAAARSHGSEEASMATAGADLVRQMAAGDRQAFASSTIATRPWVFPLILRIVRERADASDVLQEVFWEAWRDAGGYDPSRGSPEAWMIMRARTRAIDRVRATRRRSETFVAPLDEAVAAAPPIRQVTPPSGPRTAGRSGALRAFARGAARGHRARVLRRAHSDGDSREDQAAARHGEDAHPARARAPPRRGEDEPMTHEPFDTLAATYALGALDGDEASPVRAPSRRRLRRLPGDAARISRGAGRAGPCRSRGRSRRRRSRTRCCGGSRRPRRRAASAHSRAGSSGPRRPSRR